MTGVVSDEAVRLVQTIEDAGHDWSVALTRLVDGVSEYTLTYHGEQSVHEDTEGAYQRLRELKEAEKASAALAFAQSIRIATLEEAAKVAEALYDAQGYPAAAKNAGRYIAEEIRNLKGAGA